ncbi:hypothetical protein ACFYKX_03645 [Cytobacillus sp. FJAT-54145]|uniref:Lipoprotein n=1 Tax=Cytobacillus spartinae TaxID=3299023 RepID=A0ABW6K6A2_9BACI
MKLFKTTSLLLFILCILSGCTTTKEYHQTFNGVSQNWSGELIQYGKIQYKNHKELSDQYEIDYEKNETLRLRYIGEESNLGELVEYSYRRGNGSMKAYDGEVIGIDEVFTLSGGSSGTSHIPKDSEYKPVNNKNNVFEVTVRWNGQEEKIKLKYDD